MWPQRGSSISAPKDAKKQTTTHTSTYIYLLKLYVLYKPRFGVFMLILYSLLHWSTREAKTNWFSFTAHSIIQGLDETLRTNKINPSNKSLSVVSMFHHVSSTSKGFVPKIGTFYRRPNFQGTSYWRMRCVSIKISFFAASFSAASFFAASFFAASFFAASFSAASFSGKCCNSWHFRLNGLYKP